VPGDAHVVHVVHVHVTRRVVSLSLPPALTVRRRKKMKSWILLIAHNLNPLLALSSPPPMKFLRRKDNKSDTLPPPPPPPVIPDTPPQLDALPPPPPPLYARFATSSSLESLDNTTVTPRAKTGTAAPQSRNSVAPSVKTTSTKSSDVHRATLQLDPS
jgi:hypothetical protein